MAGSRARNSDGPEPEVGSLQGGALLQIGADIVVVLLAAAISGWICVRADRLGRWLGVLDKPDGRRKLHARATPLVGGFAVMLPTLLAAVYLAVTSGLDRFYVTVAVAGFATLVMGFFDDRKHISPTLRLLVSLLLALLVLIAVPSLSVDFLSFTFTRQALFLNALGLPFTVVCIVGLLNAVNMADGNNGIVGGLSLAWCLELMLFAPAHMQPMLLAFAMALAVLVVFNLQGRLFLGDSGSYAISFVVGLLTVHVYAVGFVRLPADLVALWFLVPVIDCLRVMGRRMIRGVSPFSSDRTHLHHIIAARLPSWRLGLSVYLGIAAAPALAASLFPQTTALWVVVALSLYALALAWPERFSLRVTAR